jgi:hypothetical protein
MRLSFAGNKHFSGGYPPRPPCQQHYGSVLIAKDQVIFFFAQVEGINLRVDDVRITLETFIADGIQQSFRRPMVDGKNDRAEDGKEKSSHIPSQYLFLLPEPIN